MLSANDFKKKQVIFLMTNIGDKLSFSNDNVIVKDKEEKIETGLKKFGAMIGDCVYVVCCWKYIYNEWLDTKK
mgnify:CR=1 FL=1